MIERLRNDISEEEHNDLVRKIGEAGFCVPGTNRITGLMVGHIGVENPEMGHPFGMDGKYPLPVGYIGYGHFDLVNTDELFFRDYHVQLARVVLGKQ